MNEKQKIDKAMSSITPEKYMKERIRKAVMCKRRSGDSIRLKSQVSSLAAIAAAAAIIITGTVFAGLGGFSTASSRPSENKKKNDTVIAGSGDSLSAISSSSDESDETVSEYIYEKNKKYLTEYFKAFETYRSVDSIVDKFTIFVDKPVCSNSLYDISIIAERYAYPYYNVAILIENKHGYDITNTDYVFNNYGNHWNASYEFKVSDLGSCQVIMLSFEGGSTGLDRVAEELDGHIAELYITTISAQYDGTKNVNFSVPISINASKELNAPDYIVPANNTEVTLTQPIPPDQHNTAVFNISEIGLSDSGIWLHCNFTEEDVDNVWDAIRNSGLIGTDSYYINNEYAAIKVRYKYGITEPLKFCGYSVGTAANPEISAADAPTTSGGDEYSSYIKLDTHMFPLSIDNIDALIIGDTEISFSDIQSVN